MPPQTHILAEIRAQQIIPSIGSLRKGSSGCIGVVGGSEEYTGAPYYAATSALKCGADLAHVFCERSAAGPIKSYSPDLIVHPSLHHSTSANPPTAISIASSIASASFHRLDSLVVGPGLSRDPLLLASAKEAIKLAKSASIPLVLDADAVSIVAADPEVVMGYERTVITPNHVEFQRLCNALNVDHTDEFAAQRLSAALGNVLIIQKGPVDIISNASEVLRCNTPGAPRRCGGQGDVLAGTLATWIAWTNLRQEDRQQPRPPFSSKRVMLAAHAACSLTRDAARAAFEKHKRAMAVSDLIKEIGPVFWEVYDREELENNNAVVTSQL
ncbi:Ribokinase-like protein [Cladochytrium replicatum]|nr:Ribokinase-like protein [Cladochytrium replicatum]